MANRNNYHPVRKSSIENENGNGLTLPLPNRVAHLLFTAMYLGTALWVVING